MVFLYVEVDRHGRIVLPREVRERYGVAEGSRRLIWEREDEIVLIPVSKYKQPTEPLYGSVEVEDPVDEPKRAAREHIRERLMEKLR